jgi:hypothetical protein
VLAFVDRTGQLRWVGQLAKGHAIEDGVLSLHGFFDFNAHLVTPGIATLAQVKVLLKTGALMQRYAGTLTFPDDRGVLRPSKKHLTVLYDPVAHGGAVLGPSPACLNSGSVRGVEWQSLRVSFSDGCATQTASRSRALTLAGRMTGVNAKTGELQMELIPVEPYLAEVDYDHFLADGSFASVTRVIAVTQSDGGVSEWRVGEGLVDAAGKLLEPAGFSAGLLDGGVPVATTRFEGGTGITLSPSPPNEGLDSDAALVHAVQTGAITSCRLGRTGLPEVACTLALAPSIWRRR